MNVHLELTDTFGGEANYCWVNREQLSLPDEVSDLSLVRKAKRWAGLSGMRCNVNNIGDMIEIRPTGRDAPCVVLFITFN